MQALTFHGGKEDSPTQVEEHQEDSKTWVHCNEWKK